MDTDQTYSLSEIKDDMGEVGLQMTRLDAAEGSAGNISVFVCDLQFDQEAFLRQGVLALPERVTALAGGWVVLSGTGRRLRDLHLKPAATLCLLHIHPDGEQADLYAGKPDVRPTSEYNSHLSIHNDQVGRQGLSYHAVVHAQPRYLTYLSHLPAYGDTRSLNRRLLRWEPETIVTFPEGIGLLPFEIPGSPELMAATLEGLHRYRAVVWQRHGIVTRSEASVQKAGDLVEYAETAAHFEYLNLQLGEPSEGLSDIQMCRICANYGIQQDFF